MHAGTIQANINSECNTRPCRVSSLAVKAGFISLLRLENFENFQCLFFGGFHFLVVQTFRR